MGFGPYKDASIPQMKAFPPYKWVLGGIEEGFEPIRLKAKS